MSWTEFWYNTSFHTSLQYTPFKVVYGLEPPSLLKFEEGSTANVELEQMLKDRDDVLEDVRTHLLKAQSRMKDNAGKHRRELDLTIGSMVFLKLRSYSQQSIHRRTCQKLAAKPFGPFKVLQRIGKVAYKLRLPEGSKVYHVFHISQLKHVLGHCQQVSLLPLLSNPEEELVIEL